MGKGGGRRCPWRAGPTVCEGMSRPKHSRIKRSFVPILTGCDLSRRRLPRLDAVADLAGPDVWLTACAHGDEVGGIAVVHEVFRRLGRTPLLRGSLRAFPLMNPVGFDVCSRHVTLSEEDLNRSFPGDAKGTLAERIAETIFQAIQETSPALVLDLHNDWTRTIPYVLIDALPKSRIDAAETAREQACRLAVRTAFPIVQEVNPMSRTLSYSLIQQGIPAATIELGESRVVNETNVALGVEAIWTMLAELEMVEPGPAPEVPSPPLRLSYSNRPLCSSSGILRFHCEPGQKISAGKRLARVQDAFGRLVETLRAEQDALVLGVADSSAAFPGAPAFALGLFSEPSEE